MTDTIEKSQDGRSPVECLAALLRGAGQVMFQSSVWTGALFLVGIFWGSYATGNGAAAWGALVGLVVSTAVGRLLGLPASDGRQGLWGFNGILAGCAFPTFLGSTVWVWIALVLCSALTVWVRTGLNNVMAPWRVNSLTFPFVLCTWVFLAAARAMHGLPPEHLASPELPAAFISEGHWAAADLAVYWLKGISQVFLIDSWVTGIFFLAGLAVSSPRAAVWAAAGSAVALVTAIAFKAAGADIAAGMYGFSAVLTAIALGTVFYEPNIRSAVWTLVGVAVAVFVQAAMNVLVAPLGLPTLTAPFCVTVWLFLLPLLRFDRNERPDHSDWSPENKTHLSRTARRR